MDQRQPKADGDGRESGRRAAIGSAKNDHQEHQRQHDLGDEARHQPVAAGRMLRVSIRRETAGEVEDKTVLDAAIIASAQAVEHYEIARYGTLIAWAEQLGLKDALPLLRQTLKEESATDEALNALGENDANQRALQAA